MYKIRLPNGTILSTHDRIVANGYIFYSGGEEITEDMDTSPKARRDRRKTKSPSLDSSK